MYAVSYQQVHYSKSKGAVKSIVLVNIYN